MKVKITYNGKSKVIRRLCRAIEYLSEKAGGDMMMSVYDTDGDGVVDNAELANGHSVNKDVPADALFTDTIYDDTLINDRVRANMNNISLIMSTLFDYDEAYLIDSDGNVIIDSDGNPIYTLQAVSKFTALQESVEELQSRKYLYWSDPKEVTNG